MGIPLWELMGKADPNFYDSPLSADQRPGLYDAVGALLGPAQGFLSEGRHCGSLSTSRGHSFVFLFLANPLVILPFPLHALPLSLRQQSLPG